IIHPKTIKPLQNKSIPLHVRSFVDPQEKGTWIGLENVVNTQIPSYIFKAKQVLLSIYPKDFSFIEEESLASIFSVLVKYNIRVNLMQNSALSFSVCVDECKGEWRKLISDLENQFDFLYNTELELITVRHYTQKVIDSVVNNRHILLDQRSINTVQMVIKNGSDI
ncbi:MAG: aspartate kinase, partial [Bacteroidales bacterium]